MESVTLKEAMLYLLSGGAGVVVSFAVEKLPGLKEWFDGLRSDYKRYVAWALTICLTLTVWVVAMLIGYEQQPVTLQAAVERAFALCLVSIIGNGGTHAFRELRFKVQA